MTSSFPVLALRVPSAQADEARKVLLHQNLFPRSYLPKTQGCYILLPCSGRPTAMLPEWSIIETNLDKRPTKKAGHSNIRQRLIGQLSADELKLLKTAVDIIGDIGIVEIDWSLQKYDTLIGQSVMQSHPQLAVVLGRLRVPDNQQPHQKYVYLVGEKRTTTVTIENGVHLNIDVSIVYYSPRSSSERKRLCNMIKEGERVLTMFANCGAYLCSIGALTRAREVIGVERDEAVADICRDNIKLNAIDHKACVYQGDMRSMVPSLGYFDRVLMPMPHTTDYYLDCGVPAVTLGGWLHFYFRDGEETAKILAQSLPDMIAAQCNGRRSRVVSTHRCGSLGPGQYRWCLDVQLDHSSD